MAESPVQAPPPFNGTLLHLAMHLAGYRYEQIVGGGPFYGCFPDMLRDKMLSDIGNDSGEQNREVGVDRGRRY